MTSYQGDDTTGFQSPAQDYVEPVIDLAKLLDLRRPGRYPVRVVGHELRARGIHAGDILIANAAAEPASGKVCAAFLWTGRASRSAAPRWPTGSAGALRR